MSPLQLLVHIIVFFIFFHFFRMSALSESDVGIPYPLPPPYSPYSPTPTLLPYSHPTPTLSPYSPPLPCPHP